MISSYNNIEIMLIVSDNCPECVLLEYDLKNMAALIQGIKLKIIDRNIYNKEIKFNGYEIFITPALIINGKLINYGSPGRKKLENIFLKNI